MFYADGARRFPKACETAARCGARFCDFPSTLKNDDDSIFLETRFTGKLFCSLVFFLCNRLTIEKACLRVQHRSEHTRH